MPTEQLFGAYHFDSAARDADHFAFNSPSVAETKDSDHDQWIDILSVSQGTTRSEDSPPTVELTLSYEKIEWSYATADTDDLAF